VLVSAYRQAFALLPALDRAYVALQVGGDFLPGFERLLVDRFRRGKPLSVMATSFGRSSWPCHDRQ
jgi:hypothetical protein